jgi:ATP-dependent Clp protease ATP-binding subunit ClpX
LEVLVTAAETQVSVACSFCLKPATAVAKMIGGPGVFICNECVGLCNDILAEQAEKPGGEPAADAVRSWEQRLSDEELLRHLPKIAATVAKVEQHLTSWVHQARHRGITWTRIGEALGMTRQSAWERFSGED